MRSFGSGSKIFLKKQGEPYIRDVRSISQHPLAQRWFAGEAVERILRLWAERDVLLAALDRLPRSFCHRDAFPHNLIARLASDGCEQTVAVDWAIAGTGAVGEEIATLVGASLQSLTVRVSKASELDAIVFAGYVNGLRDAGWQGDERLVRFGFAATAALYLGVGGGWLRLRRLLGMLGSEAEAAAFRATLEKRHGYPLEYIVDQVALVRSYFLDLGDEARALLDVLDARF